MKTALEQMLSEEIEKSTNRELELMKQIEKQELSFIKQLQTYQSNYEKSLKNSERAYEQNLETISQNFEQKLKELCKKEPTNGELESDIDKRLKALESGFKIFQSSLNSLLSKLS